MDSPSAYHQLGSFVVQFQRIERNLCDVIRLLVVARDEEMVNILMQELDNSKRLRTADVLFSRFLDVRNGDYTEQKKQFHSLITKLQKLAERRNSIVHSYYHDWKDVDGNEGLLRQQSKLRAKQGILEENEEGLLPKSFEQDFETLQASASELESFRLKVIEWRYPDE
jgi:hypothetical protein